MNTKTYFLSTFISLIFIVVFTLILGITYASAFSKAPSNDKQSNVIIAFDNKVGEKERSIVKAYGGEIKQSYSLVPAIAATLPSEAVDGLSRNPHVLRIEPDTQVEAVDIELDNSWGVERVGAGEVHESSGEAGGGVKVGIIDSGINYEHPDLDDNYVGGYDFYYYDDDPMDVYGHGTHVAGTACAENNDNGTQVNGEPQYGVVGVVPDCDLFSLRVLNEDGVGYWSDIMSAVEWSTGAEVHLEAWGDTPATTTQGTKMDVINLSLGKDGDPGETVRQMFDNAYEEGVLIVAAAGNSGNRGGNNNSTIYPAKFDSVIAVGATDDTDTRADFSSTGEEVELAAPGVDVYSTWNDNTPYYGESACNGSVEDLSGDGYPEGECYKYGSGTSMASPHVAGVAALVMGAGVNDYNNDGIADNKDVRAILQDTADDMWKSGRDVRYGYGLVNVVSALAELGPVDSPPSVDITAPDDNSTISEQVTIETDVTDDDGIQQVEFYANNILISTDTTSSYEATWDSTSVPDGTYTVSVTAVDTASQETTDSISVMVDNVNNAPVANAGEDQVVVDTDNDGSEAVTLDGSNSYDPDGSITQYEWFDGSTLMGTSSQATLDLSVGDYTYDLVVTDDEGATSSDSVSVTVEEASDIQLSTMAYKEKGLIYVNLSWTPNSSSSDMDIYRDGSKIDTTSDNGSYLDNTGERGNATFTYHVCEAGTLLVCSNESTATTQ